MEKTILSLLKKLVAFKSISANKEECTQIIEFVQKYLGSNVATKKIVSEEVSNLLVYSKKHDNKKPFRILFNAHLDVVPAPPEMFILTITGDRAMGRGVWDMKGAAAVMIELFAHLSREGKLPDDVGLMLVTDEEVGGFHGTKAIFKSGIAETKLFLGGEPTDYKIVYEHKGALSISVLCHGEPAHSSRVWEGENANIKLARFITQFYQDNPTQTKEIWETTYSLNLLNGGTTFNVISDHAQATFDIRRITKDSPKAILAKIKKAFPSADITMNMNEPGLFTDRKLPEIKLLSNIIKKYTGNKAELIKEHYLTDARFYSEKGIPAIIVGPVGGGIHQNSEWISISGLATYYQILHDFLI